MQKVLKSVVDPIGYKKTAEKIMAWVDKQPKPIRLLVHEYGVNWVGKALKAGKKTERDIVRFILTNRQPIVPVEFDFEL